MKKARWLYRPSHQPRYVPDELRGPWPGKWYVVSLDPAQYGLECVIYTELAALLLL